MGTSEAKRKASNKWKKKVRGKPGYCRQCCCKLPDPTELKSCDRCLAYHREQRATLRKQVIEAYGHKCQWCGTTTYEYLSIDHVNNDGKQDRKRFTDQRAFYKWIIKNDYPETLQILCFNCNCSKEYHKYTSAPTLILTNGAGI